MKVKVVQQMEIEMIVKQLEEGTTIMLEKEDGNIFILNNINVLAIEVVAESKIPPIKN